MYRTIYYLTVYILVGISSQASEPVVKLPQGEVKGTFMKYSKGDFSAFRGIPYAKPPLGSLRLKDPEEHEGWPSTLNAANFGSKCPQWDSQGKRIGDEDCLFINVFTPLSPIEDPPSTSFPVMVFIHGGNFQKGSADLYGPEGFIENKVVLVTFNYRIGVLGFLSTNDESCPGNLGLKDQVLALKWVRDNIKSFGGDSSSVTLFGQGAGAASVFLHVLSPQSQGLFHRAITQSGSPLCDWTLEEQPRTYAVEVARRLRCSTKSSSAMIDCIRQKPLAEILEIQRDNKTFGQYPLRTTPVVEKNGFLPDAPDKLLSSENFKPVPLVSGVNKDDGAFFYPVILSYRDSLERNSSFLLTRLIPLFLLTATDIRGNIESVSQALYFHYFSGIDPRNVTQVLQPFINMTTDAMFVSCNYKTLQAYLEKEGALMYMYSFEYKAEINMLDLEEGRNINYDGVSHGDELLYLFDIKHDQLSSSLDTRLKRQLLYIWTTFAETGHSPSLVNYEYPKWDPYTKEFEYYLKIDKSLTLETSFRPREVDLWLHHLPRLSEIKPDSDQETVKYRTGGFGWTMLAVAIILMAVAVVLAVLLLRKSKSQYFQTKTEDTAMK